jgi:hypothetical protein
MAASGLHAGAVVAAPVDVEGRVPVERLAGVGEDVAAHALGVEAGLAHALELAVVVLCVARDQIEGVGERGLVEARVEGGRWLRRERRELLLEQRQVDPELGDRAGYAVLLDAGQEDAFGRRILAGAVHQPHVGLLDPVGVRAVGALVQGPLGGRPGAAAAGPGRARRRLRLGQPLEARRIERGSLLGGGGRRQQEGERSPDRPCAQHCSRPPRNDVVDRVIGTGAP